MIRSAVYSDRIRAVELLRDSREGAGFHDPEGPSGFCFPFDPVYAERLFLGYLAAPKRYCIIYDVGGSAQGILIAHAYEHDFGPVWLAQERLWWIDPKHRGRAAIQMLDGYEAWAAEQGCAFVGMAGMGEDPAVAKLYQRRGYKPAEKNFLKAL